jgi:hypothetical protein
MNKSNQNYIIYTRPPPGRSRDCGLKYGELEMSIASLCCHNPSCPTHQDFISRFSEKSLKESITG